MIDTSRMGERSLLHALLEGQEAITAGQSAINNKLDKLTEQGEKLMATEQQVIDALTAIDEATDKIADNVATIATVDQSISTEMTALIAALQAAGVDQALVDQATALKVKAQAASDALDLQVPVLQGIASQGVITPVPAPVPNPPVVPPTYHPATQTYR